MDDLNEPGAVRAAVRKAKSKLKAKKPRLLTASGARKRVASLTKRFKAAKRKKPAKKVKAKAKPTVERSQRLDLRLTKSEKAKLTAKAKATRRTVTSIMLELIEKLK